MKVADFLLHTLERNGESVPIPKVIIEVRYKDRNGEWQGTHSLSINEVPKAITALQKAYEYLVSSDDDTSPHSGDIEPAASPTWKRKP